MFRAAVSTAAGGGRVITRVGCALGLAALGALAAASAIAASRAAAAGAAGAQRETDPKALTLVAELALQRGNCLEASDSYARAASGSFDASLAQRATEVSVRCEQWPIAERAAGRWRVLAPHDASAASTAGLVALKLRQLDAARMAFAQMLGLAGKQAERVFVELIPVAARQADPVTALAVLKDFGTDAKLSAPTLAAVASLAYDADHYALALGFTDRALGLDAKSVEAMALRAAILARQDQAAAAIAAARAAMAGGSKEQQFLLAETLVDLGRLDEARAELERLEAQDPTRLEAGRRLALLAYRRGDFAQARRRFSDLYGRREDSPEALYYLSLLAELQGDTDAALSGYEQLAGSDIGKRARQRAATILMRAGNRERALAVLDDAADGGGGRSVIDAAIEKAQLLSMFGAGSDAIKLLDETLARFPGHPLLRYERATALERSGRSAESIRGFEEILKECPQDSLVQNALGYTLADHNQQLARAETLIRQALSASPDSAAILDSLAWVRYRRRDAARALPLLERAWRLANDAEIAAHWGEVLWSVGRHDEASAVWSRALLFAPQSEALQAVIARFTPAARKKTDPATPAARDP